MDYYSEGYGGFHWIFKRPTINETLLIQSGNLVELTVKVTHVLRLTHIEILWRMEGSTFIGGFKYFRQDRIKFHLEWFKMMKVITLVSCAGFEEF